jgi:hypothetical protein
MKKIIALLAVVGLFTLQGCTTSGSFEIDPIPVTTSEVFEVTTSFNSNNNYSKLVTFNPRIYSSDTVLVYRLTGSSGGTDVWKLLPETHFFADGTLDFGYDFDYTNYDVRIYMVGSNLQTVADQYRFNQVIRIVIVPSAFAKSIDKNNIDAVMSTLKLNESQIQKINL